MLDTCWNSVSFPGETFLIPLFYTLEILRLPNHLWNPNVEFHQLRLWMSRLALPNRLSWKPLLIYITSLITPEFSWEFPENLESHCSTGIPPPDASQPWLIIWVDLRHIAEVMKALDDKRDKLLHSDASGVDWLCDSKGWERAFNLSWETWQVFLYSFPR